ncbi:septal ring lytic transglycosylase RlpA family protein [Aggregatibacter actinomycetemcomitans]|uniref:septal ring lytic transglycosylase RlpA family protein n=1 Tax=Aggregatibacter actinomycetemcomitans TaxID=714 RepID=UPI0011D8AEE2|nr:septal ring lytic transglycosylase RlpA family protein [Aggregatibacter actinomycetemcomitans]MBN6068803.1 septal ring lytic transglycosylase RlpA family protein [Aggregatibacter actinomycetemcomitans]MBN6086403.1 septal ring lytic transglycosylase RlpA family protein [Aggregatibacter actinomycetemcomitans]QEH44537.1 septal ring lytic transglycosylase RlpA family protein [Aggregatibacter actinomycetemcomitans]TYA51620.1 septal ring lytic transglycosylase RlpA family protein [Aggregatibacter 
MNLKQAVKYMMILFSFCTALSVQAETKKLYGIQGPSLTYRPMSDKAQTYNVKGETYTTKPHQTAKNYSKQGIASYYHHKFNGRKTSNGDIYDSTLYTAAHKTLPLNSYAVVTNMYNQRKVIVRINDRGPFAKDRIIDLSHAAAKEIGIVNYGMGLVKVEALHVDANGELSGAGTSTLAKASRTEEGLKRLVDNEIASTPAPRQSRKAANAERYEIKMVNVASKKNAEQIIQDLALNNVKTEIAAHGQKYHIHLGPFNSKQEINELKTQLRRLNHSEPLIVYSYNQ